MRHSILPFTLLPSVLAALSLLPVRAEAEVRINEPTVTRVEVVSDDLPPWRLGFATYNNHITARLIPAGVDRVFFVHGSALHLIDTRQGVVLRRWIFPDRIDAVRPEGSGFRVHTSRTNADQPMPRTTLVGLDLPSPAYWIDDLLLYRIASFEGAWFDHEAHFEAPMHNGVPSSRSPLAPQDAERLLVDVSEAVRRNPFLPRKEGSMSRPRPSGWHSRSIPN